MYRETEPMTETQSSGDYDRIAAAIEYLRERADQQPQLDEVAEFAGLSPYHFQRLFRRWAGVSPKRFLQYLTVEHAKELLRADQSVLDTAMATGLSSPSRLHDLFVVTEAVTPGEYKRCGEGLELVYGTTDSPFGRCLIAETARGVVAMAFGAPEESLVSLRRDWSAALLRRDDARAARTAARVFSGAAGDEPLRLLLRGTNFQIRVWRALLEIPFGHVSTYRDVAARVCSPDAARAVGQAVGANSLAYLIPCHRVIRGDGALGGYRWNPDRKAHMLGWEQAHAATSAAAGVV